jgi:putative phosphoesterase
MKVGLVSDIHGNKVALDAVLDDMEPVDAVVCAGDVVGYNPWPAECIEWVRERTVPTVMGNHDRAVAGGDSFGFNSQAGAGVRYAREQLSAEDIAWLDGLPTERDAVDGRVKLVHGHPDDPDRYTFPREFAPDLLGEEDVLVLGHTHVQHHAVFEEGIVVNPGSVGQPRDGDPRAAYAVLDVDEGTVTEHRVGYDIERVVSAIEETTLPEEIGTRLRDGR